MGAGESARFEAESLERAEARLRAKADNLAAMAQAYRDGASGEQRLLEATRPLARYGYYGMPDLGVPGKDSNIDLVLVGPAGVFVIDSKCWSGSVSADGAMLRHNGRARTDKVDGVAGQSQIVSAALSRAFPGGRVPVWAVMAFTGSARIGGYHVIGNVCLIDLDAILESIWGRFPVVMTAEEVDRVQAEVERSFAPRLATFEDATDDGRSAPPVEPVVFLRKWDRYGQRRFYLKDEDGNDGGYADLVRGELVGTSPVANQVICQLIPHYLGSDEGGVDAEIGRAIAEFAAGADQPGDARPLALVAGVRWTSYGRDRLYVHFLGSDSTKLDLGWVDLKTHRVHAEIVGLAPIVRYCGERYAAIHRQ